jgi:nucleoside-diphosphate-sugar epimerase
MKNILITGAKGFIGTYLVNHFKDNYNVSTIEDEDVCSQNLKPYFRHIDYVIHLAAISGIDYCDENPELANKVNFFGTENILSYAYDRGVRKVIFISSSSVYHSKGIYAKTKKNSEKMCKYYSDNLGLQTVILRLCNVYDLNKGYGVVDKFYDSKQLGLPLNIYGSGEDSYDFIHVLDIVDLIEKIIEQDGDHYGDIFDVGTGNKYSVNEIAKAMSNNIIYHDKKIIYKPINPDIVSTQEAFDWKPQRDLLALLKTI